MIQKLAHLIRRILQHPAAPQAVALAFALAYAWNSAQFAVHMPSIMDEGAYNYKGLLFVKGDYTPFQPYGPWTNKLPFSFLIPGLAQALFAPGLQTARLFALALSLLTLLAVYRLGQRLGGRWWGTLLVAAMALNPALQAIYAQGLSQGLAACLMAWSLVFTLAPRRPLWQVALGSALAVCAVLSRQNLAPIMVFIPVFLLWQQGWRAALLSFGVEVVLFAGVHAVYWPQIFSIWRPYLPTAFSQWLVPSTGGIGGGTAQWQVDSTPLTLLLAFLEGVRQHWLGLTASLFALLLWPGKKWPDAFAYRATVCLLPLYWILVAAHAWASLWKDYCPYCFTNYLAFFDFLGLLVLAAAARAWQTRPGRLRSLIIALVVLALCAGVGLGAYTLLETPLYNLPLPRIGKAPAALGAVLINGLGLTRESLRLLLPLVFGLLAGVVILAASAAFVLRSRRRTPAGPGFAHISVVLMLVSGALLGPTRLMAGVNGNNACGGSDLNVIEVYERAGHALAQSVPPGAKVYWSSGASAILLSYANVAIYPPQLNGAYTKREGGDSERLLRSGFWNDELARRWLNEADVLLLSYALYSPERYPTITPDKYAELPPLGPFDSCKPESRLRVFIRTELLK